MNRQSHFRGDGPPMLGLPDGVLAVAGGPAELLLGTSPSDRLLETVADIHAAAHNTFQCASSTLLGVSQVLDFNTDTCQSAFMKEPSQATLNGELIRTERDARGWTQGELAGRVGVKQQTIDKIEKGKIERSGVLPEIAAQLGIDLKRLIPDIGGDEQKTLLPEREVRGDVEDLPVHVATEGGPGELIVSTDPIAWILRPNPLANVAKAYGIIVVGESMVPEFEPGDVACVNPHLPPVSGHPYVFYAEGDGEARATIKRLVRVSNGFWHVKQWNPPPGQKADFTLSRKEWGKAHRVVSKNYK